MNRPNGDEPRRVDAPPSTPANASPQARDCGGDTGFFPPPAATAPPRAPILLRIGVTGHRPDPSRGRAAPDEARIRATVRRILEHISDAFDGVAQAQGGLFDLGAGLRGPGGPGPLRVISSLAEGADQWCAEEALKLGCELQCPLPFARKEYEKDFSDPTEFRRLCDQATAVMELDGRIDRNENGARDPSPAAYEAAGRALLNQSDLLLAIWDGAPSQGPGGTAEVVVEALRRGIAVIWVHWSRPDHWVLRLPEWRLVQRAADIQGDAERLKELVRELLLPPRPSGDTEPARPTTRREDFFGEAPKRSNPLHGCWSLFLDLVTGELFQGAKFSGLLAGRPFRVEPFEKATRAAWEAQSSGTILDGHRPHPAAPRLANAVNGIFLRHYAWANQLSIYYGNLYRSAFVVCYLLAAVAVFLALAPMAAHWEHGKESLCIGGELLAILAILAVALYGRHRRWHERWIDYRILAERVRLAHCRSLLGGGGQQVALAGHLATYGDPANTWMHWHYLAIERAAGLPHVRVTAEYLEASRSFWLTNLVEDQIRYHRENSARCEKMDHRLHLAGGVLFLATLAVCVVHFSGAGPASPWLTLCAAFFPALAAAFAAIRSQSEVQRLARRSCAMEKGLAQIKLDLASVPTRGGEGNLQHLRVGADRVTDLMVKESLDWRVVLLDRPLEVHI